MHGKLHFYIIKIFLWDNEFLKGYCYGKKIAVSLMHNIFSERMIGMSKTLVVYFSATGTTEKLAKKLSSVTGGDLHEIVPETLYSSADLDWHNKMSRSSIEMENKAFRPPVVNEVEHMEQYDKIYIGFPIWWYVAPTIINTFLEKYNLEGKTVIPFATSGGSGMGNTNKELSVSCVGADLQEGKVFSVHVDEDELKEWVSL